MLKEFSKIYYTGNANEQCSTKKSDMTGASSTSAYFTCSGGTLTPAKHLSLGLILKSLTETKTIASLLNCFGHCASDETIRRIHLDLEKTLFKTKILVPSHIIRKSNLSASLSWENMISTWKDHLEKIQYTICNLLPQNVAARTNSNL